MNIRKLHNWDVSPAKAIEIQNNLASQLIIKDTISEGDIRTIAGIDVSYDKKSDKCFAGVAVFSYPELKIIEEETAIGVVKFPYIPGLLTFREAPIILDCLEKLRIIPEIFCFDGQGITHPRRMGIASHLGLIIDKPSIGIAKTKLIGYYQQPAIEKGSAADLIFKGKVIGKVLRSRTNVKPIFISPGHKVSIDMALTITLKLCKQYRIPEVTRRAHILANHIRIINMSSPQDIPIEV